MKNSMSQNNQTPDVGAELEQVVRKFMQDNCISCPDAIYQTDRVIENATSFIEDLCNIIGYPKSDEELEDE